MDCGRGLNRSSTVAELGVIPSGIVGVIVVIRGRSGGIGISLTSRFNPIYPDPVRIITHTVGGVFLALPA